MQVNASAGNTNMPNFGAGLDYNSSAAQVAEQFEGLFLHKLLEPLQDNEAMFGKGAEARTFSGMFRENLAKELAKTKPLGIATQIESALMVQAGAGNAPVNNKEGAYDELIRGL